MKPIYAVLTPKPAADLDAPTMGLVASITERTIPLVFQLLLQDGAYVNADVANVSLQNPPKRGPTDLIVDLVSGAVYRILNNQAWRMPTIVVDPRRYGSV